MDTPETFIYEQIGRLYIANVRLSIELQQTQQLIAMAGEGGGTEPASPQEPPPPPS
jgi:hypothetical protein